MTDAASALFSDIFSTERKKPKLIQYKVTWPCGAEWTFDRRDLDIPEFKDGKQNGVTLCYDTLREAVADLRGMGCEVVRL